MIILAECWCHYDRFGVIIFLLFQTRRFEQNIGAITVYGE